MPWTPPHRARRHDGRRQDHRRARRWPTRLGRRSSTPTSSSRPAPAARSARSSRTTASRRSGSSRPRRSSTPSPSRAARHRRRRRRVMRPRTATRCGARGALVVWLRADPAVLAERATRGEHRPLLDGDPTARCAACCRAASRCTGRPPTSSSTPTALARRRVADRGDRRAAPDGLRRVTVPLGDRSYDVVVGHGAVAGAAPGCCRRRPAGRRSCPGAVPFAVDPGSRRRASRSATASRHKTLATIETLTPRLRPARADPQRRRRRRRRRDGHRRRRLRRRRVAPRRARRARRDDAARHGRRGDRRQDRRQPARGQEPRRRVLAAGGRDLRPRRAGHAAGTASAAPATARWPSTTSSPATTSTR